MSADGPREFVDTNVLVYAHDVSAKEKGARARALVTGLWAQGGGCLSVQVLQEFFVTVTRKVPHPLALETAQALVADLVRWTVHVPRPKDVILAIDLQRRHGISFWDALVVHSAAELGCALIWSEDLNPGQAYDGVVVRNPFAQARTD